MTHTILGMGITTLLTVPTIMGFAAATRQVAEEYPQSEISNGQIRAKVYLPDAAKGFYLGTRFDWAGIVHSLEYRGHNYYGQWYSRLDPRVHDFSFEGDDIVTSTCCTIQGPVEEFKSNEKALGFDEAPMGGTFIKIGVGVLRKDSAEYDDFKQYAVVDPGKWTVKQSADSVEFTHELSDPSSGYGYIYRKVVRLTADKPQMVLEHHLKNTGHRPIEGTVYGHNFLTLDRQTIGPDFTVAFPFAVKTDPLSHPEIAEIRGEHFAFVRPLAGRDVVYSQISGFTDKACDNEVRIENKRLGAGMTVSGNRPLSHLALWSIRSVLAVEPFIEMKIEPGSEFDWDVTYDYYTFTPKIQ